MTNIYIKEYGIFERFLKFLLDERYMYDNFYICNNF